MSEYGPDYYDKFSGKELDEELDRENQESDAEELAEDLRQAHADISDGLPAEFNDSISDIIDTFLIHYDVSVPDWAEIKEKLTNLMAEMESTDEDEFMEREEEFSDQLGAMQKLARSLATVKKKAA